MRPTHIFICTRRQIGTQFCSVVSPYVSVPQLFLHIFTDIFSIAWQSESCQLVSEFLAEGINPLIDVYIVHPWVEGKSGDFQSTMYAMSLFISFSHFFHLYTLSLENFKYNILLKCFAKFVSGCGDVLVSMLSLTWYQLSSCLYVLSMGSPTYHSCYIFPMVASVLFL